MKFSSLIASFGLVCLNLTVTNSLTWAAELAEIEERGKLIVGVKDNTRPLGFIDGSGNLAGLEIDIARRLAEEILGDSSAVEFQAVSNRDRLKVVVDNQVDIAIARVSATDSRRRIVDLSPHYYLDGTGIIAKDVTVANATGLSESKIAVLYDSTTIAVVRHRLPKAQLVGVESYTAALELLESGQVQAFAADISVLTGWVQEYPQYRLLPERLSGSALSVVMPKGLQHQELQLAVDKAISKMRKSGWLQERIEYWGLPN